MFEAAERLAERLGKSRSQLDTEAVGQYVEQHRSEGVTERLNATYGTEPELSKLDPILEARSSIAPEGSNGSWSAARSGGPACLSRPVRDRDTDDRW